MNRFVCLFSIVCTLASVSLSTNAQQKNKIITDENYKSERYQVGEELFFTAKVSKFTLGDVYTINTEHGIFIDLDSYIVAADFRIELVDFLNYQGWYINEENTFSLSRNESNRFVAKTNSVDKLLSDEDILIIEDVVYVSHKLLYEFFKIGHVFNETTLTLILHPEQKLPIQLKLERENKTLFNGKQKSIAEYPELWRGYEFLSPQSLDFSINSIYSDRTDRLSTGYSIIGGREVLYHNMRFYLNGTNQQTLSNARLLFSKNLDISSNFKNPIVKAIEFGDVDSVSIGRSDFRSNSVGLVMTNDPTVRQLNDSRTTTISGEVQEGWDVELYRNQILIDRLSEVTTGRYIFPDIPLFLGENNFEIVLYGPQGQQRRLTQNEYVNPSGISNSALRYKSSLTKLDSTLLPVSNNAELLQSDLYDWSTQFSKGISDQTSVNLGLSLQSGDEAINQLTLGVNSTISDRIVIGTTYFQDDDMNQSLSTSMRTSFFGHDFNVSYSGNKSAATNNISHGFNLNNRGAFSLLDKNLSYQNRMDVSRSQDITNMDFQNSLGIKLGRGNLSNSLRYTSKQKDNAEDQNQFLGNLSYRFGLNSVSTRLGLNYGDSDKGFAINSYSLELSWSPIQKITSRFNANYSELTDEWNTRLDVGYQTNNLVLSSYLGKSSFAGLQLGLSARFSIGGEPFNQGVFASNRSLSGNGTVIVRTFIDANANAIFDYGDTVISGVDVRSLQSFAVGTTDEDGVTALTGLSTSKKTDIEIQIDSIDEPFLMPIVAGVSILPRESFIDHIDYPLVYVSDIDGVIEIENYSYDNLRRPLLVRLLNDRNELVSSTVAEFDGYYFFSEVQPGNYIVEVEESTLAANKLRLVEAAKVHVRTYSELLTVDDLIIAPIEFNEGYRVELVKLTSLPLLKAYWQRVRSIDVDFFSRSPVFYVNHSNKYSLNIGFYESLASAQEYCKTLTSLNLKCSVEEYSRPKS